MPCSNHWQRSGRRQVHQPFLLVVMFLRVSHEGRVSSVTWGWEGPHAGRWGTGRKGILKVEVRGVGQRPALVVGHPPAPLVVDHRQLNVEPYPLPIIEVR